MTIEVILIIIGLCLAACYVVFEYQKTATPPYQEPVAPEPVAPEPDTLDNIDNSNAKVGDKIWHKEAAAELEPTPLNPKAAWPFPHGGKP